MRIHDPVRIVIRYRVAMLVGARLTVREALRSFDGQAGENDVDDGNTSCERGVRNGHRRWRAGPNPTGEKFRTALEAIRGFDVGGMALGDSPGDHTGPDFVDLAIVNKQGRFSH